MLFFYSNELILQKYIYGYNYGIIFTYQCLCVIILPDIAKSTVRSEVSSENYKMNNRLLKTCVVIYILLLLSISVIAHSGKTDSSGGHFNNSTGEYHYHHGYSAHHHYDYRWRWSSRLPL